MVRVHPRLPLFEMFQAGIVQGTGWNATNVQIAVRVGIPVPDAALRTLKFRFESGGLDQFCAVVAERQRHLIVYQDQEGSTPSHRASFRGVSWGSAARCGRPLRPALFQIPGAKLIRMSRRLLTVRQSVRARPLPPMPGASSKGSGHRSSKPGMAVRVCPRLPIM